jgi:hypothetical protein
VRALASEMPRARAASRAEYVEHVPQQEGRSLHRSEGLQGEEEREGDALEQVVTGGRTPALVRGLVRGRLRLDRGRQPLPVVPAAPPAAPQEIAAEVDGDTHEPGPPGTVPVRGRTPEARTKVSWTTSSASAAFPVRR